MEVKKDIKKTERVVVDEEEVYVLTLSREEAEHLAHLLGGLGGKYTGIRQTTDKLYADFEKVGLTSSQRTGTKLFPDEFYRVHDINDRLHY